MQDSSPNESKTAALIIIGDEILSGRTKDANLAYLANFLGEIGIELQEARVIPDVVDTIVGTVNTLRRSYDYLFTTGGIGPTHDDMTIEAVAKAFGVPLELNEEARRIMVDVHGLELNEGRLRMITLPEGSRLVEGVKMVAPGFQMDNVFVMAGIPKVMQSMLEAIRPQLQVSDPYKSQSLTVHLPESSISVPLRGLQERNPDVRIGSYPFFVNGKPGADVVLRGRNEARLEAVMAELKTILEGLS